MVMLYLMVGGPWHGTWKEVPEDRIRNGYVSIPHMRATIYERASEFGVPEPSLRRATEDRYQLRWFELKSTGRDEAYIGPLVWLGMPRQKVAAIVGDAFHAACDPFYVPAWTMPRPPSGFVRLCLDSGVHEAHPYSSGVNGEVRHYQCPGVASW